MQDYNRAATTAATVATASAAAAAAAALFYSQSAKIFYRNRLLHISCTVNQLDY